MESAAKPVWSKKKKKKAVYDPENRSPGQNSNTANTPWKRKINVTHQPFVFIHNTPTERAWYIAFNVIKTVASTPFLWLSVLLRAVSRKLPRPKRQHPELFTGPQKPLVQVLVLCGNAPTTEKEQSVVWTPGVLTLCSRRPIHCQTEYPWRRPRYLRVPPPTLGVGELRAPFGGHLIREQKRELL